jgi:glycosyltransferase 2 family protein
MPDRPAISGRPPATAAGGRSGSDGGPPGGVRALRAAARQVLTGPPVRLGFGAAAVAIGGYAVARQWTDVRAALASIGAPMVAAAMVSVLIAMFAAMQVWRVLLAALGSPLPIRVAARIMFVGQLGKYVPGSIWPVLAQMELGNAHRVPRHHSASASVLTMLVSMLSGLLAALVTLPFLAGSTPYLWAFLAAPGLLACLHPKVLNSILGRLFRLTRRPPLEQPLTARAIGTSLAWSFGSWIFYGLQIWLLATRLGAPRGPAALLALGGFAFAWIAGFLAVFAPAGAGVREVVLVALLGPMIGVGAGTAVALVSRALTTIGDLLAAAAAAGYFRQTRARSWDVARSNPK